MKKAFITGVSGFAGSHLAQHLLENKDYEISGTYLTENSLANVENIKDKIKLFQLDLLESKKVADLVSSIKPDLIFHLAALPSTSDSFNNPSYTFNSNINPEINILQAVKNANLENTRILVVSSAEVYGLVAKEDLPVDEETPLMPFNPYAVSKIAQDFLGLQYFLSFNLKIIRVRPFNHIGPRQTPGFVVSSFAKKIAEIEKGKLEPVLKVGNLEPKRDFTDVRDMVCAYDLILEKGKEGDCYNIGSGISYQISDILDKMLSFAKVKIKVENDPSLFRPSDTPELLCDNKKIKEITNWTPKIPIDITLKETLDYWRKIV
ncbi:SDR family oxidoreductase [Candidatus Microgenomates bacterium]|nr:MAG: SDR family oxidoreductase [Candidatus Microgenomates bacterium]